jgi:pimeloyl-ACP methyl ester carboxylesterase
MVAQSAHRVMTHDGVAVSIDLYSEGAHETVVIVCPGFFQSKDTPTFHRMSQALANERDVLAMDFRGHGRSSGLYTFSACEGADLEAVLRWAQARYRHVGILSFSLGAAIAINTVSRHQDGVKSLVAVSAPSSFEGIEFRFWTPEAMRTGVQGLEPGAGCRPGNLFLKKERPIESVRKFQQVPILFIHGTRDAIIGAQHSRRLYAAAPEPKKLEIVEGGGHAEALFRDAPQRLTSLVHAWLLQTLMDPPTLTGGGMDPGPQERNS